MQLARGGQRKRKTDGYSLLLLVSPIFCRNVLNIEYMLNIFNKGTAGNIDFFNVKHTSH